MACRRIPAWANMCRSTLCACPQTAIVWYRGATTASCACGASQRRSAFPLCRATRMRSQGCVRVYANVCVGVHGVGEWPCLLRHVTVYLVYQISGMHVSLCMVSGAEGSCTHVIIVAGVCLGMGDCMVHASVHILSAGTRMYDIWRVCILVFHVKVDTLNLENTDEHLVHAARCAKRRSFPCRQQSCRMQPVHVLHHMDALLEIVSLSACAPSYGCSAVCMCSIIWMLCWKLCRSVHPAHLLPRTSVMPLA